MLFTSAHSGCPVPLVASRPTNKAFLWVFPALLKAPTLSALDKLRIACLLRAGARPKARSTSAASALRQRSMAPLAPDWLGSDAMLRKAPLEIVRAADGRGSYKY